MDPKDIVDLEQEANVRGYFALDEDEPDYPRPPSRTHQAKTILRKLVSTRH